MIDFKKMDDKDFVFVSKPLSDREEKEFSEFLKSRKTKSRRKRDTKKAKVLQEQQHEPPTKAGVASVEHASILTEEAIRVLLKNGTYIVPTAYLNEPHNIDFLPAAMRKKAEEIMPLARVSHTKAIKAGVKFAFGTDAGLPKELAHGENAK